MRYGHQIMVAHENDDFQVVEQWEPVTEVDVQTPREVYEELSGGIRDLGLVCATGGSATAGHAARSHDPGGTNPRQSPLCL